MELSKETLQIFVNNNLNILSLEKQHQQEFLEETSKMFIINDALKKDNKKLTENILNFIKINIKKYLETDFPIYILEDKLKDIDIENFFSNIVSNMYIKPTSSNFISNILSSPYFKNQEKLNLFNDIKNFSKLTNINYKFTCPYFKGKENVKFYEDIFEKDLNIEFKEKILIEFLLKNLKEVNNLMNEFIENIEDIINKYDSLIESKDLNIDNIEKNKKNDLWLNLIKEKFKFISLFFSEEKLVGELSPELKEKFYNFVIDLKNKKNIENYTDHNDILISYFSYIKLNKISILKDRKNINNSPIKKSIVKNQQNIIPLLYSEFALKDDKTKRVILKNMELNKNISIENKIDNFIGNELLDNCDKTTNANIFYNKFINSLNMYSNIIIFGNNKLYDFLIDNINITNDNIPIEIDILFRTDNINLKESIKYIKNKILDFELNKKEPSKLKNNVNFLSLIISNPFLMKKIRKNQEELYKEIYGKLIEGLFITREFPEFFNRYNFQLRKNKNLFKIYDYDFLKEYIKNHLEIELIFASITVYDFKFNYNVYRFLNNNYSFLTEKHPNIINEVFNEIDREKFKEKYFKIIESNIDMKFDNKLIDDSKDKFLFNLLLKNVSDIDDSKALENYLKHNKKIIDKTTNKISFNF